MSRTKKNTFAAGAGVIGLGLLAFALARQPAALSAPALPSEPTIRVRAVLDKSEVTPGTTVRLTETVPANLAVKVHGFMHVVIRAGRYDRKSDGIVNLLPEKFEAVYGAMDDGLPLINGFSEPRILDEIESGRRGKVYEFKPKQIGVFLIRTQWSVKDARHPWHSPPVVLVVIPPTDKQGQPILKDEWLGEEERR